MDPISVVLVDDHQIVRKGLRAILEGNEQFNIVGEAATGEDALVIISELKPNVVILDLKLNDMPGDEVCRRVVKISPKTAILILTAHYDNNLVAACLHAGARGYLLKDAEQINLPEQLVAIVNGYSILDPRAADALASFNYGNQEPIANLSAREWEILQLISRGLSNSEISAKIFISENTIKTHIKEIYSKLDVHNRVEAVIEARKHGLL
jgi:two-component system, NarL family, response regulator DevR